MGTMCCGTNLDNNQETPRQILRFYEGKKVQIYDFLSQTYDECIIQSTLSDFLGCSQIQIGTMIYLCGTSPTKNEYDSSFMYSIDTSTIPLKTKIEVNSFSSHYYPTLVHYNKEYIFVIGGKRTTKCEYYFIKNKKWKVLPCLPEERYGAIGLMHSSTYHLYIFGGIESESGKYQKGVLKIGLPSFIEWEFINIKQNESYFQRAFSLITSNSLNNFFILGGQKEGEGDINDILVMEINNDHFDIKESKLLKLPSKMSFRYYKASMYDELDHTLYYYNENADRQIVKINPNTFEVSEFSVGIKKFK